MFSKKCKFQIVLAIHDLSNLPYLSGLYYAKYKLGRIKGSTQKAPVKNHVVSWNQEIVFETYISVGRDGVLQSADIVITIKQALFEDNTWEKIGIVSLNLSEFAGERMVSRRLLLRDSNVNCILRLTIDMKLLKGDPGFLVPRSTIGNEVLEFEAPKSLSKQTVPILVDSNVLSDDSAIVGEIFAATSSKSKMWPRSELLRAWAESVEFLTRDTLINSIEPRLELIKGSESCSVMLVNTEFGNSYGKPVIGTFPNLDCKSYNQVVLKLKASVEGRQFDRTGAFWLGGTELLRFTTAEPSGQNSSTEWNVEKDVSKVEALFKTGNSFVLALDNIVNDVYTGVFKVSVSLDFYYKNKQDDVLVEPASLVYPLSASTNSYGWFMITKKDDVLMFDLPDIPSNTIKLELDTFWSAHRDDEFWYFNVPNEISSPSQGIFGGGSFKELIVHIDDTLVAMDWLFPTIYSGGMNPLLWRPIVSIGTFDVPYSSLDLTYSLPLINGKNHKISLSIGSEPNPHWFVSSRLLIWTDGEPEYSPLQKASRGEILKWDIRPTKVYDFSSIDFKDDDSKKYKGVTEATNRYYAKSKIRKSDGSWFIADSLRRINFRNEVVNSKGNSTVVCKMKSVINEESRGMHGSTNFRKSRIKDVPLHIKLESITEGKLFEFRTDLMLKTKESNQIQTGSINYYDTLSNNIHGTGYFGTIRPGVASQSRNLIFKSPDKCYSRFIKASNQSIESDQIFKSCKDFFIATF